MFYNSGKITLYIKEYPSSVSSRQYLAIGVENVDGYHGIPVHSLIDWSTGGPVQVVIDPIVSITPSWSGIEPPSSDFSIEVPLRGTQEQIVYLDCMVGDVSGALAESVRTVILTKPSSYVFVTEEWSDCTSGCQGSQSRKVFCQDSESSQIVSDEFCVMPTCVDSYPQWVDIEGASCSLYEMAQYCDDDMNFGAGWNPLWGNFERFANFGLGAAEACCACGGGDRHGGSTKPIEHQACGNECAPDFKHFHCMLGSRCQAELIGGHVLETNQIKIALSDSDCYGPYLSEASISPEKSNLRIYDLGVWNAMPPAMPTDVFPLCWSRSENSGFAQIGVVSFLGPIRTDESFQCTVGSFCELVFVDTSVSRIAPRLSLVQTDVGGNNYGCGVHQPLVIGDESKSVMIENSSGIANEGRARIGFLVADPGEYSVCWGSEGISAHDFNVFIGKIILRGPFADSFHCVAGKMCSVTLPGYQMHVFQSSELLILETGICSDDVLPLDLAALSSQQSHNPAIQNGYDHSFGLLVASGAVAYPLCWRAASHLDFLQHVGFLRISGPILKDDAIRKCEMWSKEICSFDLAILDPKMENRIQLRKPGVQYPCPGDAIVTGTTYNSWLQPSSVSSSSASFDLVDVSKSTISEAAICWMDSLKSWDSPVVYAGTLSFYGPLYTTVSCQVGRECIFESFGQNFGSIKSSLALVEQTSNCGATVISLVYAIEMSERSTTFSFGNRLDVGSYHACFLRDNDLSNKFVQAGQLYVEGPYAEDHHCVLGELCVVSLTGINLNANNMVMLAERCSIDRDFQKDIMPVRQEIIGEFDFGVHLDVKNVDVSMKICWSATMDELNGGHFVQVGEIQIMGPSSENFECAIAHDCTLSPSRIDTGHMILSNGQDCARPLSETGLTNPTSWTPTGFHFGRITSGIVGGQYSACWKSNVGQYVRVGLFLVSGPDSSSAHSFECFLGTFCSKRLGGHKIQSSMLSLVKGVCESPSSKILEVHGFSNPTSGVVHTNQEMVFSFGVSRSSNDAPGGYQICWGPETSDRLMFHVGTFWLRGPNVIDATCEPSFCNVQVRGFDLGDSHQIQFVHPDTACGVDSFESDESGVGTVPMYTPLDAWTGIVRLGKIARTLLEAYRICWRHAPSQPFLADIGVLKYSGPIFRSYHCTVGQECHISISGNDIPSSSGIIFTNSCGQSNSYFVAPAATNRTHFTFTPSVLNHANDLSELSVCWGFNPDDQVQFDVMIGQIFTSGPFLNSWECALNMQCVLVIEGINLRDDDQLFVADDCELPNAYMHASIVAGTYSQYELVLDNRVGARRVCWGSKSTDQYVDIGQLIHTGPNLEYFGDGSLDCTLGEICEISVIGTGLRLSDELHISSAPSCDGSLFSGDVVRLTEFRVDYRFSHIFSSTSQDGFSLCFDPGDLVLIDKFQFDGPVSTSNTTVASCVAGSPCQLTLIGNGFLTTNSIVLSQHDCGLVEGQSFVDEFRLVDDSIAGSSAVYTSQSVSIPSSVGVWHICWDHDLSMTSDIIYAVNAGSLEIWGPLQVGQVECFVGALCELEVPTFGHHDTFSVLVNIGDCNIANPALQLPRNPAVMPNPSFGLLSATWQRSFSLCFGSGLDSQESFNYKFGDVMVLGPVLQNHSCITAHKCMLSLEGFFTKRPQFGRISVCESSCTDQNAILSAFVDNHVDHTEDRMDAAKHLDVSLETIYIRPRTDLLLCYFFGGHIRLGQLIVTGPHEQDFACLNGAVCIVELKGVQLESMHFSVGVLNSGQCSGNLHSSFTVNPVHGQGTPSLLEGASTFQANFGIMVSPAQSMESVPSSVCWGPSDLSVFVGKLKVNGPLQKDVECQFSQMCKVTLDFVGLEAADVSESRLAIVESNECGLISNFVDWGDLYHSFLNPATPDSTEPMPTQRFVSATFIFNLVKRGVGGDGYILCWSTTQNSNMFPVNVGQVVLKAPSNINLNIEQQLGSQFHLQVESIGSSVIVFERYFEQIPRCQGANDDSLRFSPIHNNVYEISPFIQDPYQYSICFSYFGNAFYSSIGQLHLSGPEFRDEWKCVLGNECTIVIKGSGFSYKNAVQIVYGEDCTSKAKVLAVEEFENPAMVTLLWTEYARYTFGVQRQVSTVSTQLCWSPDPTESNFLVPLGSFSMIGPYRSDFTCIRGVVCKFLLTGNGLSSADSLMLSVNSCEDHSVRIPVPSTLLSEHSAQLNIIFSDDEPEEAYQLCWTGGDEFSTSSVLPAFVGHVSVVGAEDHFFRCKSGLRCVLELKGSAFSDTNAIRLVPASEACGTAISSVTVNGKQRIRVSTSVSYSRYDLGLLVDLLPSRYRVCWGHYPVKLEDCNVDAGILSVAGPISASQSCVKGVPCHIDVNGHELDDSNHLSIMDLPCRDANGQQPLNSVFSQAEILNQQDSAHLTFRFEISLADPFQNKYLCWNGAYEIGIFTLIGPEKSHHPYECWLGKTCRLDIGGVHLSGSFASIVVNSLCNASDTHLVVADGVTNPSPYLYHDVGVFDFGQFNGGRPSSASRTFQVCWGQEKHEHIVHVAELLLHGPEISDFSFVSDVNPAKFLVEGYGLRDSDRIQVIKSDRGCGFDDVDVVLHGSSIVPKVQETSSLFEFETLSSVEPGDSYKVCFGYSPLLPSDFNFQISLSFEVKGPSLSQSVQCWMGRECADIVLHGFKIPSGSRIRVANSCNSQPSDSVVLGNNPSIIQSFGDFFVSVDHGLVGSGVPGKYDWCWSHSGPEVQVGTATIFGPHNIGTQSCFVSQEQCEFGIDGLGFSGDNQVKLVVAGSDCSMPAASVAGISGQIQVFPSSHDSEKVIVHVGHVQVAPHTSRFDVCWFENILAAQPIKIGTFVLTGPLFFESNCVRGFFCAKQLSGSGSGDAFGKLSTILVKDSTCEFRNSDNVLSAPVKISSNGLLDFGLIDIATVGEHSICVSSGGEYATLIGKLTVVGVLPQDDVCILGEICSVTHSGYALDSTSTIILRVNSCSGPAPALQPITNPANGANGVFDFGRPVQGDVETSKDVFKCWSPLSSPHQLVNVGRLEIHGPIPQNLRCTVGHQCSPDVSGHGGHSNLILLSNSRCGAVASDADVVSFESVSNGPFWKPGAHFQLCWSSRQSSNPNEYRVVIDPVFSVIGVSYISQACTLGLKCAFSVQGYGLDVSTSLALVSDAQFERHACYGDHDSFWSLAHNPRRFNLGVLQEVDRVGMFKLCWAWPKGNYSHVGEISFAGPFAQSFICTMGLSCVIEVAGTGLSISNHLKLVNSASDCSDTAASVADIHSSKPVVYQSDRTVALQVGFVRSAPAVDTSFGVCWYPSVPYAKPVKVGTLGFHGPLWSELICISGTECILSFVGDGFASTNRLRISTSGCGDLYSSPPDETGMSAIFSVDPQTNMYHLSTLFGVGSFALCWSSIGSATFPVQAGNLIFDGPEPQDSVCWLGESCEIVLSGLSSQRDTNKLRIVSFNSLNVADGGFNHVTVCGGRFPDASISTLQSIVSPAENDSYLFGQPLDNPGHHYALCWGYDPRYWSSSDFNVLVGRLLLNGPYPTSDVFCFPGSECQVDIKGLELSPDNVMALSSATCDEFSLAELSDGWRAMGQTSDGLLFSFGEGKLSFNGHAFLCWARGSPNMDVSSDRFAVQVGEIFFRGPSWMDYICVRGVQCLFDIPGLDLTAGSRVRVARQGRCNDVFGTASLNGLSSIVDVEGATRVDLGLVVAPEVDIAYDLCWSASSDGPIDVLIGTVQFDGPFPQDVPCTVAQQPCRFSLRGTGFQMSNRVTVVNSSCSADQVNEPFKAPRGPESDVSTYAIEHVRRIDSEEYVLCWAATHTSEWIQVGKVRFDGPVYSKFDCIIGDRRNKCKINWQGNTAATKNTSLIFIESGQQCASEDSVLVNFANAQNPLNAVLKSSHSYGYNFDPQSGAGENMGICWKNDPESNRWDASAGSLTLFGPHLSDFECILGLPCTLGITGVGLVSTSRLLLAHQSCTNPVSRINTGHDFYVASLLTPSVLSEATTSLQRHDFGVLQSASLTRPSAYKVCFAQTPLSLYDFIAEVGSLTINGPFPQDYNCIQGMSCAIQISGAGISGHPQQVLAQGNRPCGSQYAMAVIGMAAEANPAPVVSGLADFGQIEFVSPGSLHRICWFPGTETSDLRSFIVEIDNDFEILGVDQVSASCIAGQMCSFSNKGFGLDRLTPMMLVIDPISTPCGDSNVLPADIAGYSNPVSLAYGSSDKRADWVLNKTATGLSGSYGLCFNAFGNQNAPLQKYNVFAGHFHLLGPFTQDFTCTLGESCNIPISSFGMESDFASVIILSHGNCGDSASTLAYSVHASSSSSRMLVADQQPSEVFPGWDTPLHTHATFKFPAFTSALQTSFLLCWQHGRVVANRNLDRFNVPVGQLYLHGPLFQNVGYVCTNGMNCIIHLSGDGFSQSDRLAITIANSCGQISSFNLADVGLTNPAHHHFSNASGFHRFDLGVSMNGIEDRRFRICFARNPDSLSQYIVNVGLITFHGPTKMDFVCKVGIPCVLEIMGHGLQEKNGIMIKNDEQYGCTHQQDGSQNDFGHLFENPARPTNLSVSIYNHSTPIWSDPTVSYHICWTSEYVLWKFNVVVGRLQVFGPILPQKVTCWNGAPCLPVIRGRGFDETSGLALIEGPSCSMSYIVTDIEGQNPAELLPEGGTNEAQFSFGAVGYVDPERTFRLCFGFSSSGQASIQNTQYLTEIQGDFYFSGIKKTNVHCTLGRRCIHEFNGRGLKILNSLRVIQAPDCLTSQSNVIKSASANGNHSNEYDFGVFTDIATGTAILSLCFSPNPSIDKNFGSHVGFLILDGPGPTPIDQECIAGEPCTVNLIGRNLSKSSIVTIIDGKSCDAANAIVGDLGAARSLVQQPTWFNSSHVQFDLGVIDRFVRSSMLICWGSELPIGGGSIVEVGRLSILGVPAKLHVCTIGAPCQIELEGSSLSIDAQLTTVEIESSCISSKPLPVQIASHVNNSALSADSKGSMFTLSAPANRRYRLCYSRSPNAGVVVDVGFLQMKGPIGFVLQNHTDILIAGHPINVSMLYYNYTHNGAERIAFSKEPCGRMLNAYFSSSASDGSFVQIIAVSGRYYVCWCGFNRACDDMSDFASQMSDTIFVIGPEKLSSILSAADGEMVTVHLEGTGLGLANGLSLRPGSCDGPGVVHPYVSASSFAEGMAVWTTKLAIPGSNSICWCSFSNTTECARPILVGYAFAVDVASISRPARVGQMDDVIVEGKLLSNRKFFIAENSCSSNAFAILADHQPFAKDSENQFLPPVEVNKLIFPDIVFSRGGSYLLCYCRQPDLDCTELRRFTISGPNSWRVEDGEKYSSVSIQSQFNVILGPLERTSEMIHLVPSDQRCNGSQSSIIVPTRFSGVAMESDHAWQFLVPVGGLWRICYCGEKYCSTEKYMVEIGAFSVLGPSNMNLPAIRDGDAHFEAGRAANLRFDGVGIGYSDQMLVGCDRDIRPLGLEDPVLQPGPYASVVFPLGGNVEICVCWPSLCDDAASKLVSLGAISVAGPVDQTTKHVCDISTTSSNCKFDVGGHFFSKENRWTLVSSAQDCNDRNMQLDVQMRLSSSKLVNIETGILPFGDYSVCWSYDGGWNSFVPGGVLHVNHVIYNVTVGNWSNCSASCGGGTRTRIVECHGRDQNGTPRTGSQDHCIDMRDIEATQECNSQRCVEFSLEWNPLWQACSSPCGSGVQHRSQQCIGDDGILYPFEKCNLSQDIVMQNRTCHNRLCHGYNVTMVRSALEISTHVDTSILRSFRSAVRDALASVFGFDEVRVVSVNQQPLARPVRSVVIFEVANVTALPLNNRSDDVLKGIVLMGLESSQQRDVVEAADWSLVLPAVTEVRTFAAKPKPITYSIQWSLWSGCSRPCGGGIKNRTAICMSSKGLSVPLQKCNDTSFLNATEEKECNLAECPDDAEPEQVVSSALVVSAPITDTEEVRDAIGTSLARSLGVPEDTVRVIGFESLGSASRRLAFTPRRLQATRILFEITIPSKPQVVDSTPSNQTRMNSNESLVEVEHTDTTTPPPTEMPSIKVDTIVNSLSALNDNSHSFISVLSEVSKAREIEVSDAVPLEDLDVVLSTPIVEERIVTTTTTTTTSTTIRTSTSTTSTTPTTANKNKESNILDGNITIGKVSSPSAGEENIIPNDVLLNRSSMQTNEDDGIFSEQEQDNVVSTWVSIVVPSCIAALAFFAGALKFFYTVKAKKKLRESSQYSDMDLQVAAQSSGV